MVKGGREKIAPYRGTMVNEEGKVVIKEVSAATVGVSGRGDDERLGDKSMGGVANVGVPTEMLDSSSEDEDTGMEL